MIYTDLTRNNWKTSARWCNRVPCLYLSITWQPSPDKSAWAGAVGFRKAIMKSQWSPRRVCSVLRREVPQVADSPTVGLATDLETALSSCGLSYNAIWPWSCHQHHIPKDPGVVTPACASGVRPADVGTNYGLRSGQWPSSSPSAVARKPRGKLTRQSDQRSWNSPITSHSKTKCITWVRR